MVKVAFYKGRGTWINALIRWWTRGPYSHSEVVVRENPITGSKFCYTADRLDGGIRGKWRDLDPAEWDFVEVDADAYEVELWYLKRVGCKYDLLGLLGFVFRPDDYDRNKYFCSEANAASLGINEAWRFDPNSLKHIVDRLAVRKGN